MTNILKQAFNIIFSEKTRILIRLTLYNFLSVFYIGRNFTCNCCGKNFRKLKTFGFDNRKNARCPYCLSLERERLMKFYFEDYLNKLNTQKRIQILHFAPETSLSKLFKSDRRVEYFSADINPVLADYEVNIEAIGFPDNSFDLIICSHVLAHVVNEKEAISEMKRVLKPDGILIIVTYLAHNVLESIKFEAADEYLQKSQYQNDSVFRFHGGDFSQYLSSFGLSVGIEDYRLKFSKEDQMRYCLGNGEREQFFICRKNEQ